MAYPHIIAAALESPWALEPSKLAALAEFLEAKAAGIKFTAAEIEARTGSPGRPSRPGGQGAIAVLNVMGVLAQHANQVDAISGPGGTSTEVLGKSLAAAINDPGVEAIILNIDSPGGSVFGIAELAGEIFRSRGKKKIIAQINSLAASAAYWLASQADEVVITPNGEAGSIGVYALHRDVSKAAEMEGLKFTFVSAGEHKTEGNPYEPLSQDARAALQARIDEYYDAFVSDVARGRGVSVAKVKSDFGKGRVYGAQQSVRVGMADRIGTLNSTLTRLGASSKPGTTGAALQPRSPLSHDARARRHEQRMADDMRRRRHRLRKASP